jgi:hypothetical protein
MKITSAILAFAITFGSVAQAATIASSQILIKPTRITKRVSLVDNRENGMKVQVLSVFEEGATDVSNTSKVVLAIGQLGEMNTVEASFLIGESIGLESARRVSAGIYEVKYVDANQGIANVQTKIIDAKKAVSDIKHSNCAEFATCEVTTSVDVR